MNEPKICVVYCDEHQQYLIDVPYQENMTASDVLQQSKLAELVQLPEALHMGVFGLKINEPEHYVMKIGDRLEIYRPLKMNPNDVRKRRAAQNPIGSYQKGNQWKKQHKND